MNLKKFAAVAIAFLSLSQAQARYGEGGWVFGGIGAGGVMVKSKEPSDININFTESDKIGYSVHLKGGVSWYFAPMFVADGSLGFVYSSVSGDAPAAGQESVSITHTLGLFQLSPRFRFGDLGKWQVGLLYKLYFGSDTAFRESESGTAATPMTHYLGLQFNYDMPSATEKTIYRFGVEALTDVSDPRTIFMGNLVFEMGFNLWGSNSSYEAPRDEGYPEDKEKDKDLEATAVDEDLPPEDSEQPPAEGELEALPVQNGAAENAPPPPPPPPPAAAEQEEVDEGKVAATSNGSSVLIKFPADRFQFATAMSHIGSKQTRAYLRDLGEFMSQNDSAWGSCLIVGHTDRRGNAGREREINKELSEGRARTVYNALVAAGMNPNKMRYEGHGFDEPLPGAGDNPAGWRANRRVTLTFEGVRKPDALISQINDLNKRYGYKKQRATKKR
jgi:outer membrane protein OmpA-like peptidoglycan-associated protein